MKTIFQIKFPGALLKRYAETGRDGHMGALLQASRLVENQRAGRAKGRSNEVNATKGTGRG